MLLLAYIGSYLKHETHRIVFINWSVYHNSLLFGWHEAAKEGPYYEVL